MMLATIVLVAFANDVGFGPDVPLRYAEADATRFVEAMSALGRVDRLHRVIGGNTEDVQRALRNATRDVKDANGLGEKTLLVFYYSGHADGDYVRAGGSRMTWTKLRELIGGAHADLTLAVVDACDSGAAIGKKGGSLAPPFSTEVFEAPSVKGTMWITSSRGDEASYESDEIGGSFFSHFLVSGIRGAADLDEDGRVTLGEAYQFTFDRTVSETSIRLRRTQHPTYRSDLIGEGDIVLSELSRSTTTIVLPRDAEGEWFLARRFGSRRSVLEVPKRRGTLVRMSVQPGGYLVYKKEDARIMLAEVNLQERDEVVVDPNALKPYAYSDVLEKGGRVALRAWALRGGLGVTSPIIDGASRTFDVRAALSARGSLFGFGGAVSLTRHSFGAVDTRVDNEAVIVDAFGEIIHDAGIATFVLEAGPSVLFLAQHTTQADHVSLSPGLVVTGIGERRVFGPVSVYLELGARLFVLAGPERTSAEVAGLGGVGVSIRL